MGNFIRENTAKRETAGREKQSSPLKSNLPENFLLLCTRLITREQLSQIPGAFVGSFWCPSNSLFYSPKAPGVARALLQDGHRDTRKGREREGSRCPHICLEPPHSTVRELQDTSCVSPGTGAAQ